VNRLQHFAILAPLFMLAAWAPIASETAPTAAPGPNSSPGEGPKAVSERLSGSLDVILLLDKSLSMASFYGEVKTYIAGDVLGPILAPGDRLIVELVYGTVQRLYSGLINSEADKASAIRSLRAVEADGPFTDLGKALDIAARDIEELGRPDRPKYVLLVTDERQEAPAGSPYQVSDYRLRHPSLEYVKRVDLGRFRAITIGLQVKSKVESAQQNVLRMLSEAPESRRTAGSASSTADLAEAEIVRVGPSEASGPSARMAGSDSVTVAATHENGVQTYESAARPSPAEAGRSGDARNLALLGAAVGVLALAAALAVPLVLRHRRKVEKQQGAS
jgi:hypothetical protein